MKCYCTSILFYPLLDEMSDFSGRHKVSTLSGINCRVVRSAFFSQTFHFSSTITGTFGSLCTPRQPPSRRWSRRSKKKMWHLPSPYEPRAEPRLLARATTAICYFTIPQSRSFLCFSSRLPIPPIPFATRNLIDDTNVQRYKLKICYWPQRYSILDKSN